MNPLSHPFALNEGGYQQLFSGFPDPVFITDTEGKLLFVNDAWMSVLGYRLEDVTGTTIISLVVDSEQANFTAYLGRVSYHATSQKITARFKTAYHTLILLEGFVTTSPTGESQSFLTGFFRDITQTYEAEAVAKHLYEELTRREYDLQQLLEFAPDAVVVIDQQGLITFWNPMARTLFGWTTEEVIGTPLSTCIIPLQYRAAHTAGMNRFLATGETHVLNQTIEITALRKSGEEFDVSLTISTTRQAGEIAFIAFIRDITAQKTISRELDKHRRALEDSNRELEQFAHVASHDMKEPIRKINLFVDRMRRDYAKGQTLLNTEHLNKIAKSSLRLITMVEGVLQYSSLSGLKANFEWLDPNEIIRHIEEDLEVLIRDTGASLHCGPLPGFEGVPFLIHQLFYNLVSNSLKFAKEDIPTVIEITGTQYSKTETSAYNTRPISYVALSIKDNGIGFAPTHAEEIFQTFTRLHSKDSYEGTGLGLALCKRIVVRHQGEIRAHGEQDKGAVFTIILPQKQGK